MSNQHDGKGKKYFGMEVGVVVDNKDPLRVHRCRVRVPGICEPYSAWALPIGGGKGVNRGPFHTPDVGAEVSVWFKSGDPDFPYYMASNWGTGPETPGAVGGYADTDAGDVVEEISAADATKIKGWEGDRFIVQADERAGKERLFIRDKKSGDQILFDGVKYVTRIKGTALLHLVSDGVVKIDGAQVNINGRIVASNGRPIR